MQRVPICCKIDDLDSSLALLRKDLTAISEFDGAIPLPILYNRTMPEINAKQNGMPVIPR